MFDFLAEPASLTDKPGEGPFQRAFIDSADPISLCIENELGEYKTVLHMRFDSACSETVSEAYFSKGDPFNFDNWSKINLQDDAGLKFCPESETGSSCPGEGSDRYMLAPAGPVSPICNLAISCCEVIFAMKAMLTYSGVQRTLASQDHQKIAEAARRLWIEGKHKDPDPAIAGNAVFLRQAGEREVARMRDVMEEGNAERMKKTGREFSGVFTFAGRDGDADLRLDGIPWHRIACALLYHLKLRLWLGRPGMRMALARLFRGARVREVSTNDALYAVIVATGPKVPGTSPVDTLVCGSPAAAAAAAAATARIDDDWGSLDEGRGNLLGKVCQAAIASLVSGELVPDFGAPAAALRRLGFGAVLLTSAEVARLAEGKDLGGQWAGPGADEQGPCAGEAAGSGRVWLSGLLRRLGVREIGRGDLALARVLASERQASGSAAPGSAAESGGGDGAGIHG